VGTGVRAAVAVGRVLCAALLVAMSTIHLVLLAREGFDIPVVGSAFLLSAFGGLVLATSTLLVPRRWLTPVALSGTFFTGGTVGALVLGMVELLGAVGSPLVSAALLMESVGIAALTVTAVLASHRRFGPR
jgi:hypothetical protein